MMSVGKEYLMFITRKEKRPASRQHIENPSAFSVKMEGRTLGEKGKRGVDRGRFEAWRWLSRQILIEGRNLPKAHKEGHFEAAPDIKISMVAGEEWGSASHIALKGKERAAKKWRTVRLSENGLLLTVSWREETSRW